MWRLPRCPLRDADDVCVVKGSYAGHGTVSTVVKDRPGASVQSTFTIPGPWPMCISTASSFLYRSLLVSSSLVRPKLEIASAGRLRCRARCCCVLHIGGRRRNWRPVQAWCRSRVKPSGADLAEVHRFCARRRLMRPRRHHGEAPKSHGSKRCCVRLLALGLRASVSSPKPQCKSKSSSPRIHKVGPLACRRRMLNTDVTVGRCCRRC
jgi:hypothetical protein